MIVGGFIETALTPIFGIDIEKHTFTFYGKPEKEEPLISVRDVARYVVESTLLPKSKSGERQFRVPGGPYAWKEVVETISKVQGVEYTSHYLPLEDAIAAAKERASEGDVDGELLFSLKTIMGDPNAFGVPKPWDNEKFSFEPESLEVAVKRFFEERKSV